jgi:hypothetical protein
VISLIVLPSILKSSPVNVRSLLRGNVDFRAFQALFARGLKLGPYTGKTGEPGNGNHSVISGLATSIKTNGQHGIDLTPPRAYQGNLP